MAMASAVLSSCPGDSMLLGSFRLRQGVKSTTGKCTLHFHFAFFHPCRGPSARCTVILENDKLAIFQHAERSSSHLRHGRVGISRLLLRQAPPRAWLSRPDDRPRSNQREEGWPLESSSWSQRTLDDLQSQSPRGSFDEAIKDCSVVLHTASPVELKNQNRDQLVAPAVQGTLNVLRSAARTPGIRRVVLTSSMAAVYIHCDTKPVEHVFTEDDWSHEELIEMNKMWYCVSKTLAERAAWNFMENLSDAHFDLVAMCPTRIHGPMFKIELNESSEKIYDNLVGNVNDIPRVTRSVVDVRDVAFAHIAAFENPQASGRYTLVAASPTEEEIARAVKAARPNAPVASKLAHGTGFVAKHCSSAKAEKELGIRFIPLEDMVRETCDSLTRIGLVSS
ncbi:hypothetical protein Ae201684P_021449 [Aphanomyces euteiches]|nr:hypothetical protein Ae201684P_021449 [Aphanomyces euteiches]